MNTQFMKKLSVVLAVAALVAFGTLRVFAANIDDGGASASQSRSAVLKTSDDQSLDSGQLEKGEDFSFAGQIKAIAGMVYTIGDMTVTVDASTRLDKGLIVGSQVKVEVVKLADGSLLAKEIEAAGEPDQEIEIEHANGDDQDLDAGEVDDRGMDAAKLDDHGIDASKVDDHSMDATKLDGHGTDAGKVDDHGIDTSKLDDHGGDSGKVERHGGDSGEGHSRNP